MGRAWSAADARKCSWVAFCEVESSRVARVGAWLQVALERGLQPAGVVATVFAVSLLCGLFVYPQAWVISAAAGVLLAMGLVLPGLMVWPVRGRLVFSPTRCRAGDAVDVRLELYNRAWYPVAGLELSGWVEGLALPEVIGPRRTVCVTVRWVPSRRGCYPQGEVVLVSGFPLGLVERWKPVEVAEREGVRGVVVHPDEVPVEMPTLEMSSRPGEALLAGRRSGNTGELTGLRPYRRGDAVRDIHWRQTARQGRLIVRERQLPANPRVVLVLDADAGSYTSDGHRERAISVAAWLLRRLVDANFYPALVLGSSARRHVELSPGGVGPRAHRLTEALDALARLDAGGEPLAEVLLGVDATYGSGDAMVVVTSPETAALLRAAAPTFTVWQEVPPSAEGALAEAAEGRHDATGQPAVGSGGSL